MSARSSAPTAAVAAEARDGEETVARFREPEDRAARARGSWTEEDERLFGEAIREVTAELFGSRASVVVRIAPGPRVGRGSGHRWEDGRKTTATKEAQSP